MVWGLLWDCIVNIITMSGDAHFVFLLIFLRSVLEHKLLRNSSPGYCLLNFVKQDQCSI